MKEKVMAAAVQMDIALFDEAANLAYMESAIKKAKEEKNADLVVFPELCSIGYIRERNKEFGHKYVMGAEKVPGEFTEALGEMAKK